jgi:phospholipase C
MSKKTSPRKSKTSSTNAPVTKVVIFFMENHTTDNFASEVPGVNGNQTLPAAPDVVVPDPPHDHGHWMLRKTPAPGGARRERYSATQLPNLALLMNNFTVCDNYYSDYAGNSFPNHCFAIGADAEWAFMNPGHRYTFTVQTPGLPARLAKARKTWANYGKGFAFAQYKNPLMHRNVKTQAQFLTDAKAGRLPNVSWVYGPRGNDFHAGPIGQGDGSSMKASDAWLGSAVKAVATGKDWLSVMAFITFDDWGGWDDHVDPPAVEMFPKGTPFAGEPYRYGSRVPCLVIGPYAKKSFVSHAQSSHVSLVAFIERLWGLPPSPNSDAKRRTATDTAMQDCYDLTQKPLAPPNLP